MAENVTLAQVVRLVTLAQSLDERHYEVHFACSRFDELVFEHTSFRRWHISTIPRTVVDRALASGRRLYERSTLRRYVQEETRLLAEVRPDLVVGDFRQSLAVSAPLARVPYANLINAYWSPYAVRDAFPLPDHPIVRLLGEPLAARHFPRAVPWFFDYFARPLNDLRREHGLPRIGSLPEVLTYGDYTLYPDTPELAPTRNLPSGHRYLGPVPWSPALEPPGWWSDPQVSRECVYVTLGSSGNIDVLPTIIEALQDLSLTVMLSTAGRATPSGLGRNFRVVEYLPGELAARRSALVISNGGSTTGYQALAQGTPVLGIPYNLDQYLAMQGIERAGAGLALRAGSVTVPEVRAAVALLLARSDYRERAREIARALRRYDARQRFADFVATATAS